MLGKLQKSFEATREAALKAGGYMTHPRDDEDSWRYPNTGHTYWNHYGPFFSAT